MSSNPQYKMVFSLDLPGQAVNGNMHFHLATKWAGYKLGYNCLTMRSSKLWQSLVLLILAALIALPRLVGLKRFVSVDEPAWLMYSANFYYALGQRQFEKTVYEYHPAVTSMWIVTAAMLSYFPEYRGLGQGYIEKYWQFDDLLTAHGKHPLELLWRSRLIAALVVTTALVIACLLVRSLLGEAIALGATLLIAFGPYFLGHSRLLNHEALLAVFLLNSLLSLLLYLEKGGKPAFLGLSAVFAALALLTKSSAILIFPLAALMTVVRLIGDKRPRRRAFWGVFRSMLSWLALLAGVFFLLWPGMWVAPGKMLYEVYGNAFSYALQGSRLSTSGGLNPAQFNLDISGIRSFLIKLSWGTTPLTWLGLLIAVVGLFSRDGGAFSPLAKKSALYFALSALLFILLFGVARGRDSSHYILTSYVCLDAAAGVGLVGALSWLGRRLQALARPPVHYAVLFSLISLQALSAFPYAPYYYTYANPLRLAFQPMTNNPNLAYGEGLERAAAYLAEKPGSEAMTALSWYATGSFSYFFPGEARNLKTSDVFFGDEIDELRTADYLVIYIIQQERRYPNGKLLKALEAIRPETSIWINGVEYARIYAVASLPEVFFREVIQP